MTGILFPSHDAIGHERIGKDDVTRVLVIHGGDVFLFIMIIINFEVTMNTCYTARFFRSVCGLVPHV